MRVIALNQKKWALVSDQDYARVSKHRWFLMKSGYAFKNARKGVPAITMHRFIMNPPPGLSVDHRNGNKLDNRRINLRVCSHIQNCWNAGLSKANKTGYKGVDRHSQNGSFRAQIMVAGKLIHLGCFDTAKEAGTAYDRASKKFHGKFSNTNKRIHERRTN